MFELKTLLILLIKMQHPHAEIVICSTYTPNSLAKTEDLLFPDSNSHVFYYNQLDYSGLFIFKSLISCFPSAWRKKLLPQFAAITKLRPLKQLDLIQKHLRLFSTTLTRSETLEPPVRWRPP